ncbi:hypothetical protein G7Y79_00044g079990 [Physcia stellaris]|nr:hypothetical protein G7Y79_00044g079990 [Physcia stellaris]
MDPCHFGDLLHFIRPARGTTHFQLNSNSQATASSRRMEISNVTGNSNRSKDMGNIPPILHNSNSHFIANSRSMLNSKDMANDLLVKVTGHQQLQKQSYRQSAPARQLSTATAKLPLTLKDSVFFNYDGNVPIAKEVESIILVKITNSKPDECFKPYFIPKLLILIGQRDHFQQGYGVKQNLG